MSTCLNDYQPIALTHTVMKCFEWLVLVYMKNCLASTLDPYRDGVSILLHFVLTHLDNNNTYSRMLFVNFISAVNTRNPARLVYILRDLGMNTSLCHWIIDFLTNRHQHVKSYFTTITQVYHRALCWAHYFTSSSHMTAGLSMDPIPSCSLLTAPETSSATMTRQVIERKYRSSL